MDKTVKQRLIRPKYRTCSLYLRGALHAERGYFATDDCFAKKSGGPSTRSATHLHVSHEKAKRPRISRKCPVDFSKTWKIFSREKMIIDTYIKRKISLSLTFLIHCSSPYAQVFYRFFFVVLLRKGEQRLLEKRETQQILTPIWIRSRIFLTRHAMTSRYCVAYFTKVEKFWTGNCTREIGCFYK